MSFVKKYGKILLPLITPYKEDEEVDYEKYAELIEYLIEKDLCDSLIVTGTTGEASLLSFDERVKLIETAIKASAGRKPVIAGTGCASTKETIALTKKAEQLGIELCLIVCPFYNKPTQEGLYLHYKAIAESTNVNIMLYNIPIFVGVNLEPETVSRLAAIPNIVAVKDEAGVNPTQVTDFILASRAVDPDFAVYNGDDVMLLPTIKAQDASVLASFLDKIVRVESHEFVDFSFSDKHILAPFSFLVMLVIGIMFLSRAKSDREEFIDAYRHLDFSYSREELDASSSIARKYFWLGGIIGAAGIILFFVLHALTGDALAIGLGCIILSVGIWFIVYGANSRDGIDLLIYNYEALRRRSIYSLEQATDDPD